MGLDIEWLVILDMNASREEGDTNQILTTSSFARTTVLLVWPAIPTS